MAQGPDSQVDPAPEGEPIPAQGISVQATAIVGVGLVVSQVIAMLQMLVVARILGPEQYGVFGAMAVVLLIGSTVLAATQVTIARHVASGRSLGQIGASSVLAAGLATFALGAAIAPLLSRVLNLDDVAGLLLVAVTFVPFAVTGAQLGLLQGYEKHSRLGALYVISTLTRVLGAIAGAALGQTADSAMLGLAIGATLGAVVGQFVLVERIAWRSRAGTRDYLVEAAHAAHALIALYALTNLDVLLARAQLSAFDAGLYAAGALVARAVFFLPQAILVAAFPRIVAGARNAQRQAVAAVAVLGLLATAFVALFPTLTVGIMAGEQYLEVTDEAWLFALAGAGFGVVQVLLYARMAHNDRRATILLWTAVAALVGLGLTLGTSIGALVTCAATVAWTTAIIGIAWARLDPVQVDEDGPLPATM
ncbi:MAG: oligosaccharide flippase family protein [Gammaproteobacteria bacterium]|jgi:O-antigen/teichoic acid export membrane protein|nr:oligosaccharide flippase family protein [Gammaproteobacteria bacterium]